MLEQDEMAATVLERRDGAWISILLGAGDTLTLSSIEIEIPVTELYEGLDLAKPSADGDV